MGHGGMSKRQLDLSPTSNRLDNSLPQFPRPPSDRPSLSLFAELGAHDRRRHPLLPLHPGHLRPGHRPPASSAIDNPLFPLMSAGDDDSVGGRALLRDFLTFLDLKGTNSSHVTHLHRHTYIHLLYILLLRYLAPYSASIAGRYGHGSF